MFDINVFVLWVSGIVCFQSFVASNICELFLWQDKGNLFSERTYFWRNTTLDATVWGKIWNALILVDNNVFVLQATQSINSLNLEALYVFRFTFYNMSNFMFSERTYFDGTPTSKIWSCGTVKLKGQLQSFYPKCLELGWEFINKILLIILFI